ncbi:MAG: Copper-binding protein CopC (methionine-rich) [Chloroflexi bacterium]|nr:MAG: Copper-binding protein CopC (methionine-rich) [Chloroflexota bacterium]
MTSSPLAIPHAGRGILLLAALLLAILTSTVGGPATVFAHAAYDRSEPAFAAELDAAPQRVDLWFSQQLFRQEGANTFAIRDPAGTELAAGELTLDRDDRRHAFAEITIVLSQGRYFLAWTNLSADDGDDEAGRTVFYVGRAATAAEIEEDRALAADALIAYPGDAPDDDAVPGPTDAPAPPQPIDLAEAQTEGGLDDAVIGIAIVGAFAITGLVLTGRRRERS